MLIDGGLHGLIGIILLHKQINNFKSMLKIFFLFGLNLAILLYGGFLVYVLSAWPADILKVDFDKTNFYWIGVALLRVLEWGGLGVLGALIMFLVNRFFIEFFHSNNLKYFPGKLMKISILFIVIISFIGAIQFFITTPIFGHITAYNVAIEKVKSVNQDQKLNSLGFWKAIDNPLGDGILVYTGAENQIVYFVLEDQVYAISEEAYTLANSCEPPVDYYDGFSIDEIQSYLED